MLSVMTLIEPTVFQLEMMRKKHCKELKQLDKMTDAQFNAFKRNFSFGSIEGITKAEARELLMSMLALNLKLSESYKNKK